MDLLIPRQDFYNIIIKLTECSKKEYLNTNILYPEDFDTRGNRLPFEYSKGQKRGKKEYIPPLGWIGIGLNITNYKNWDIKCGKSNKEGEWCVAYHGTDIENAKNIITEGLKAGERQLFRNSKDNKGELIGEGVYFSPLIEVAENYTNSFKGIKCVFMCRVNPERLKEIKRSPIYVINDPGEDIIPYRLLIRAGYNDLIN